jgi:hypothetical protein
MRQAELSVVESSAQPKDSSEQAVQIGADRGDGVEASLSGRCPDLSNVKERANQVQQPFEQQHARGGVVVGCQASRRPKSVLRGDPQIVRAGGVERWLASSHNRSDVITNSGQRAIGVLQDFGRRPRVGGSVAVLRKVGVAVASLKCTSSNSCPSRSATSITNPGRSTMMARSASLSGRARSPSLGTEEQNPWRRGISRQFIHERGDCRVHRFVLSKLHRPVSSWLARPAAGTTSISLRWTRD